MFVKHLINKQRFDLCLMQPEEASDIQRDISKLNSERLMPAFERLFDRLAEPDQLIRLGRIELDLGSVSKQELFSDIFTQKLIDLLESAIAEASNRSSSDASVQPLSIGRFEVWLYFLENGYLPAHASVPESLTDWYEHIFDTLASDGSAVQRLQRLLSHRPIALERLAVQYDDAFLQEIVTLITGHKHNELPRAIRELGVVIIQCLRVPVALSQWLTRPDFWQIILQEGALPDEMRALSARIAKILKGSSALRDLAQVAQFRREASQPANMLRQVEVRLWRIVLEEAIIQGHKSDTPELLSRAFRHESLRHFQRVVLKTLARSSQRGQGAVTCDSAKAFGHGAGGLPDARPWTADPHPAISRDSFAATPDSTGDRLAFAATGKKPQARSIWRKIAEAAKALPKLAREPAHGKDKATPPDIPVKEDKPSDSEDVFYILNAGVILLHPFLPQFFRTLELTEGDNPAFKDEWNRGMAVCLLHYLAADELRSPEYQLVLPKLLCGMPLNSPVDHTITISAEAQTEGNFLLQAAIDHWGALGSSSPDGLREGFLQRAGKLERRQSRWFLQVERKTLDILLDRLPWGIGVVKLPWMEEVLHVKWR